MIIKIIKITINEWEREGMEYRKLKGRLCCVKKNGEEEASLFVFFIRKNNLIK
jgi:hypothetical protein